ncbi:MAG TPA: OmpA family protein [Candidatus Aminicenantes bacterium]|nr:OmpA family protein [Candidatus Aminicenantes bacterium]
MMPYSKSTANTSLFFPVLIGFVILVFWGAFFLDAGAVSMPDETEVVIPPGAQAEAEKALKRLGPERGALRLDFKVLTIEGIIRGFSGRMQKIRSALNDLGAKETETEYVIQLESDVLFDFDQWEIRADAGKALRKVSGIVRDYDLPVTITGHTDSKGSESYNMELSKKRAESVKTWLVKKGGVDASQIETTGKGESEPVAPNSRPDGSDDPEGRQKNRRVEIRIKK